MTFHRLFPFRSKAFEGRLAAFGTRIARHSLPQASRHHSEDSKRRFALGPLAPPGGVAVGASLPVLDRPTWSTLRPRQLREPLEERPRVLHSTMDKRSQAVPAEVEQPYFDSSSFTYLLRVRQQ